MSKMLAVHFCGQCRHYKILKTVDDPAIAFQACFYDGYPRLMSCPESLNIPRWCPLPDAPKEEK